ncbi:unnamed protein product [Trichobilharzia szidati]|nr:unnamed protein product [Trichobilharzia szidati]
MEKRRRVHRIRQSMTRCYTASQQLSKQQASLVRHFVTVAQRKKILVVDLDFINQEINQIHDKYFTELLGVYFVTELSTDGLSPDRFVDSPLHIDKENIFTGPEPTPSSHTALTYCSVAIRVATILLDVWLPLFLRRSLHLVGSFLSALPQRDDMGRVYSAVIHAVHLLCQSRGIDVKCRLEQLGINVVPGRYTYYNPLFGLYCLGNPVSYNNKSTRYFDECYTIKLNGLFGTIPSFSHFNHSVRIPFNSCCFHNSIEKGEEVDEMFGLSSNDSPVFNEKSDNPHTINSTPTTSECCIHSSIMSGGHCEDYKSPVSLECWELVSLTPPPPPLNSEAIDAMSATHPPPPATTNPTTTTTTTTSDSVTSSFDSLHHSSPLSTVWRLAKVIMRTSEAGSSESNC